MEQDITHLVERLEAIEDKVGIRLEGLYAWLSGPDSDEEYKVELNGEAHAVGGTSIDEMIQIVLTIYDDKGRVIGTATDLIDDETFIGIQTFSISDYVKYPPKKIRLYPKFL